jgi:hypothetical protein
MTERIMTEDLRTPNERIAALEGAKFVSNVPDGVGHLVAMCVHKDRVYVAAQFGVFVLNDDHNLEQMMFVPHKEQT